MSIRQLLSDDDAVSPVIGVILMVAITVILAAVIGAFVLGFGGGGPSAPTASWDTSEEDGNITFTADSVSDEFDASTLSVNGTEFDGGDVTVTANTGISVPLSNGSDFQEGDEVSLTWSEDGSSSTLATHSVENSSGVNLGAPTAN